MHAWELRGKAVTVVSLSGLFKIRTGRVLDKLSSMSRTGLIRMTGDGPVLTEDGRRAALRVIRAHRLLERYMHDELGLPLDALHEAADKREHRISPEQVDALEMRMGFPTHDPHGDPIPTGTGELTDQQTTPLLEWEIDEPAVIMHLEDEPKEILTKLVALGLHPGMQFEILESGGNGLILWDGEREYAVSSVLAGNVFVTGWSQPILPFEKLTSLSPGETAVVRGFTCEGLGRRRLLDLGLTPGTKITHRFDAAFGDPRAFEIRGAVIALRQSETDSIEIERELVDFPEYVA